MKTLSVESTKLFNKIVEMAEKENGYLKIENNHDFMPLSVEVIERYENNKPKNVSIAHYINDLNINNN